MYATPFERGFFPGWKFSMPGTVSKYIDPKIQIGTIIVFGTQLVIGGAWMLADHYNTQRQEQLGIAMQSQLQQLLIEVPLTRQTIEVNGNRISELEKAEHETETRIGALEAQYGIAHNDLEGLKTAVHDIVAASQLQAPVRYPKGR